ncbi:glucans biosynthesis glucosyltransferase MdoH [Pseudomonas sp. OIL-1]|uniref:glucans biosynthesis glucosyltransferase MdoH n=1 Tax=Pseudomonas sp. OIL-1 TaxID=2706126 RepID=UPI0013A76BFC|nr:glucans biosynthesis glucosyltransferase MdoH [Pseudomonas sp. OIL-1]QIB51069.1 glucans biosynthesis glucosyltransferase MdoH [Pseudomonas sp. OIL-1]
MTALRSELPEADRHLSASRWRCAAAWRRSFLLLAVLLQTAVATYFMLSVLPYNGGTALEIAMAVLFAILFTWISIGFWVGLIGFCIRRIGGDRHSLLAQQDQATLAGTALARTAIVMPIYHESVERSLSGLKSVYRSLERTGQLDHFDFHILSDSRDPDIWLREQTAWAGLCKELGAGGRLFYRRRTLNLNYKSGNIGDFLRRWGRNYPYMVVLDADSLMGGRTLVRMVQLMQRHPRVGILQTSPALLNGESVFARVQQFGNQLYGPLFTTGLAAVQLGEAAFWGHNAILRTQPFMKHCGLRKLPGWGLFRGPIMSHDFVEAAYMGRAGLEVWLEPGLDQSYEESPPTLVEELTRDRRWAKGNMQHLWLLLRGKGMRAAHRMALVNGIMSYFASPLWLAFLVLTTVEAARMVLMPIDYFPDPHQLHPLWPQWEPIRAVVLVAITMTLLFLPKFLALIDALLSGRARAFGGFVRMTAGVLMEIFISALLAPIRMLAHSRYILEAVLNVTLRWAGQNRAGEIGWGKAILNQAIGTLLAISWSSFAWWLDPMFFLWSLPVALPLVLAAPIFVILGKVRVGQGLRRRKLLMIPEETQGSDLVDGLADTRGLETASSDFPAFYEAVIHPRINALQVSLARDRRRGPRAAWLEHLCHDCLDQGPRALDKVEQSALAGDATSLLWLHRQAWQAPVDSPWGRILGIRMQARRREDQGLPPAILTD